MTGLHAFVAYKESSSAMARSAINKANAAKKTYRHHLSPSFGDMWLQDSRAIPPVMPEVVSFKAKLLAKGIIPQTSDWPERSKF